MIDTISTTAGIDTSKDTLDVAVHRQAERLHVSNDAAGFADVLTLCVAHGVTRVGIEATGGYERAVAAFLRGHAITVDACSPSRSALSQPCTCGAPSPTASTPS